MNFREHLIIGFIVVLALAVQRDIPPATALAGSFFVLLGAVLPDIDHPLSYVRKAFNFLLFGMVFMALSTFLSLSEMRPFLRPICGDFCNIWIAPIIIAAILSALAVVLISKLIPPHRGPLHSFLAVVVFGAGAAVIASYSGISDTVLVGTAAAAGYASHVISDFFLRG